MNAAPAAINSHRSTALRGTAGGYDASLAGGCPVALDVVVASEARVSVRAFVRRRFVRWYMGRVAGRFCPCEWPIKSKRLMHLCGRIDDAYERESFRDFCGFVLDQTTSTSSTAYTATTLWRKRA